MPANLTPQYLKAEQKFRSAQTTEEKIEAVKEMLATLPKHKGTEKIYAELKRKLAEFKKEAETEHRKGKHGPSFKVPREGAAQVVLVGYPNVGKSQIVAKLTDANVQVADYPFTTRAPAPGMMKYEDIQIQLVDTPPVTPTTTEPGMFDLVRAADAVIIVVDLGADEGLEQIEWILERFAQSKISLLPKRPLKPLTDGVLAVRTFLVGNKDDLPGAADRLDALKGLYADRFMLLPISAQEGRGLGDLMKKIYEFLDVIRVYTKEPGQKPDLTAPYVLPRGSTVLDLAGRVHNDFRQTLKFARLWGTGAYSGQSVGRDHVLSEKDVVELHT
jgi:ribosome-interacting GTPase 1